MIHIFQVKAGAAQQVYRSARDIVEEVMTQEVTPTDVGVANPALVTRAANRYRSNLRPEEPKDLDFVVCIFFFVS